MALTNEQKEIVVKMRIEGFGYRTIATKIGAGRNQVRDYCRSKKLTGQKHILETSNCEYCKQVFEKKSSTHLYCSDRCRNEKNKIELRNRYTPKVSRCRNCQEIISGNGNKVYCSDDCKEVYNTIAINCVKCNQSFKTTFKNKKYCSTKCMGEHRAEGLGQRIEKDCMQCGKEFITTKKKNGKYCSPECVKEHKRKTHLQFSTELLEAYDGSIVPLEIYKGSDSFIKYKCLKCGYVGEKIARVLLGKHKKGCGSCYGYKGNNSEGIIVIEQFLKRKGIEYQKEYGFKELKMRDTLRYDFALIKDDSVNILIEYDGRQHFEPVERWGGEKELERIKISDRLKNKYAKDNSIPLVRIKYDCEDIESELERNLKGII